MSIFCGVCNDNLVQSQEYCAPYALAAQTNLPRNAARVSAGGVVRAF